MTVLWQILVQFIFRVTFGVALAMAWTPSRLVTSGFYRVHLWVLMGLNTFISLAIFSQKQEVETGGAEWPVLLSFAVGLAVVSYVGAVLWLYEKRGAGAVALALISAGGLLAVLLGTPWSQSGSMVESALRALDHAAGGLLLGSTLAAMFLGHWYLNTPSMQLRPLQRLVLLMAAAVILRSVLSAAGVALHVREAESVQTLFWIFVAFRWLSGLLGVFILAVMAWYTLKIPNTQSATGILYAGVILAFIGELVSQLLSVDTFYPL